MRKVIQISFILALLSMQAVFAQKNDTALNEILNKVEQNSNRQNDSIAKYKSEVDAKFERLEYQLEMKDKYVDYKNQHVEWWLDIVGILVGVFGVAIPVGGFFIGRRIFADIQKQKKEVDDEILKLKKEAAIILALKTDAEKYISELKAHESEGKKIVGKTQSVLNELEIKARKIETLSTKQKKEAAQKAQVLKHKPNISEKDRLIAEAYELHFLESYTEAITVFLKLLDEYSDELSEEQEAEILFKLGFAYKKNSEFDLALKYYSLSLEIDPNDDVVYNNRGNVYEILGEYSKAIDDYNEGIKLNPSNYALHNNLSVAFFGMKNYPKALECTLKAMDLNAKDIAPQINALELYIVLNKPKEFEKLINSIDRNHLDISSKFITAFLNLIYEVMNSSLELDLEMNFSKLTTVLKDPSKIDWSFLPFLKWLDSDGCYFVDAQKSFIEKLIYKIESWRSAV